MRFNVEYTDTFGGEANYSWVHRASIEADGKVSNLALMRRAKLAVAINGLRGTTSHYGECIEFRPYGMCTVLFITPEY